ncbi:MAG: hypothetical protein WC584_00675 [Candidatus Pacearchaeota archaeon]
MKILFVCKHNRFRSKVAEAYFNKINKNKNIKVASAGIFKGFPTEPIVVKIGKRYGLNINKNTNGLKEEAVKKIDLLIIVANDVPAYLFKSKVKNILVWKIRDANSLDKKEIEKIMKKIFKKIDELNRKIGKLK